jgi:hypothetical protein
MLTCRLHQESASRTWGEPFRSFLPDHAVPRLMGDPKERGSTIQRLRFEGGWFSIPYFSIPLTGAILLESSVSHVGVLSPGCKGTFGAMPLPGCPARKSSTNRCTHFCPQRCFMDGRMLFNPPQALILKVPFCSNTMNQWFASNLCTPQTSQVTVYRIISATSRSNR